MNIYNKTSQNKQNEKLKTTTLCQFMMLKAFTTLHGVHNFQYTVFSSDFLTRDANFWQGISKVQSVQKMT